MLIINSVRKLLNLRLFKNQENGKNWDKSVMSLGLEVLLGMYESMMKK